MIWIQHDFYSNFTSSVGSGDTELATNIFVSEVTDLLVYKTDKLFDLFDKVGIKYSPQQSDEEIIDKIIENIQSNEKFVKGLAFLMAENNDSINENKGENAVKLLNNVSGGIRKIANEFKEKPRFKQSTKIDLLDMTKTKESKVGDRNRRILKKDNTVLWLVLLVGAGFGAYYLWKYVKRKEAEKLANGGVAITPTPEVTPTSQVSASPTPPPTPPLPQPPSDVLLPPQPQATVVTTTTTPIVTPAPTSTPTNTPQPIV